jgi:hypothetical protein
MTGWNANPFAIFVCQVVAIVMLTIALCGLGYMIVFSLADVLVRYDQSGIVPVLIMFVLPLCFGWWFYTKALRRLAARLTLAVPVRALGIPIVGEFYLLSAIISPR